jgi:hypothetical protein
MDSVAAFLLSRDALHDNYRTRPLLVYLDTRIGLPHQRLYVEQLADAYDEQLWTLRTHEKFEDRMAGCGKFSDRDDAGRAPAARDHSDVQNELKGRQRDKLADLCDGKPIYVTGIRKDESPQRAKFPKGEEGRKARFVKPCYGLSKADCAEVILRHDDCPINPAWVWPHVTDCFCLANGDPSEVDAVAERFPAFAQRLREIEEAAATDDYRGTLGWDGLSPNEKDAREHGHRQMTLCSESCNRRTPSAIERAILARVDGASPDEAISILRGGTVAKRAVADGGEEHGHTEPREEDA